MAKEMLSLQKIQMISLGVLVLLTGVFAAFISPYFGLSVLVGGVVSTASFFLANRDILFLVNSVASLASSEARKATAEQGQKGYLVKFWLRLVITGVILFLLIRWKAVNIFGLVIGLSTVVVTVMSISIFMAGHYTLRGRR